MVKIGSTTIPFAGWAADPRHPEGARNFRLETIRGLVEKQHLAAIELSLDLGIVFPQIFDRAFYTRVGALQEELGFTCTVHLPFLWIDPASLNEPIRQSSEDCLLQGIQLTGNVQVQSYVLHLWGNTTVQIATLLEGSAQYDALLGFMRRQAERSLGALCQVVEPELLCVETLEAPHFEFALPLVEKFNTSICLDVGHVAWNCREAFDFVEKHRQRIAEIHLHDFRHEITGERQILSDHLALGRGEFDYQCFLEALRGSGYKGTVIVENNTRADLETSLKALEGYLHV